MPHFVDYLEKRTLATFPKYKCNVKHNNTTTTGSITSEDQHKWLIPCCSAHLKKRFENTTLIEKTSKVSPLINSLTPAKHKIKNLNDDNIQDDLP